MGTNNKGNGIAIVLSPEKKQGVWRVNRASDRVKYMKMEAAKRTMNGIYAYASQVVCTGEEKCTCG